MPDQKKLLAEIDRLIKAFERIADHGFSIEYIAEAWGIAAWIPYLQERSQWWECHYDNQSGTPRFVRYFTEDLVLKDRIRDLSIRAGRIHEDLIGKSEELPDYPLMRWIHVVSPPKDLLIRQRFDLLNPRCNGLIGASKRILDKEASASLLVPNIADASISTLEELRDGLTSKGGGTGGTAKRKPLEDLVDILAVKSATKLSVSSIRRLVSRKKIRSVKLDTGSRLFDLEEVKEDLEALRTDE